MPIQFILGGSGTGKTTYLYNKMIKASMEENHRPIIFLLPEQSNMAAEQDMVRLHPQGGTMEISILSFTRLAFKVFDERNIHTKDILDDYGKSMLIMKLLKEHQEEFTYYGSMTGKNGFVDEIKSMLSELYQYQITGKALDDVIARLRPDKSLYHKLSDLRIILNAFDTAMSDSYMVTEQILSLLKEVAGESELLRNADIYFDGFTGFTPVQYDVIEELMKMGNHLYFSVTMDENLFGENDYSKQGLFALSKQTVNRLCNIAQNNQTSILPHIGMEKNYRVEGRKELYHLERQMFRFPYQSYEKETEQIHILEAQDEKEEALFAARVIKQYVMEQGYHYRDFAIITGDLNEKANVWKQAMEQVKVPYFLDFSEPLAHNPVVEIVGMVMELFRSDFSFASVFSFLKTGFLDIPQEEIYELENYALKYGVKGYGWWSKAFRGGVKGLHERNETREKFMKKLEKIAPVFLKKKQTAKEYIQALYQFMAENNMAQRLQEKGIRLEQQGKLREAKAYFQVYEKYISVLDKTMDILGEEEVEREHFMEILMTGISDLRLGVIPSTLDQVIIGDIERTRLHHVRILFVTGNNEGLIPKNKSGNAILADKDRKQLKEMQVELAPDSKEEMFLQQFYFYLQITKPSEQLFIIYRSMDAKGAALRPSYFINRFCHIFPKLVVETAKDWMEKYLPTTELELMEAFTGQLENGNMEDASVLQMMQQTNESVMGRILDGYFYNNRAGVLDKAIAGKLFGNHMIHSVSRLETYAGCAYQFFLKFGLKLSKREEYTIETSNIGTILHAVMEQFFKKVKAGEIDLQAITKEERDAFVQELAMEAAREENETIFESSYRNRHQLEVMIRIAKRSIENLYRHLTAGEMQPAYFEKRFSPEDELSYINMALEEDVQMELSGIVDRVDIKETEDAVYVKVIDYKSGAKDIDYVKMYEGKQLQLTVYMSVMLELLQRKYPDKKIIPTGMYYYQVSDPVIEETGEEKIEQKRIKESRLSGLVNDATESLIMMDGKTGSVVPVNFKKDGEPDARNTTLVSTQELFQISEFVREKMIDIGNDIVKGQIEMNPEKGELNSPCNLCDFKNVCRFEPGLGGNAYRIGSKLDKKEAKNRILKKEEQEGENA